MKNRYSAPRNCPKCGKVVRYRHRGIQAYVVEADGKTAHKPNCKKASVAASLKNYFALGKDTDA